MIFSFILYTKLKQDSLGPILFFLRSSHIIITLFLQNHDNNNSDTVSLLFYNKLRDTNMRIL